MCTFYIDVLAGVILQCVGMYASSFQDKKNRQILAMSKNYKKLFISHTIEISSVKSLPSY